MYPENINSYHFYEDYKAEVVAAEIVEQGFPEEQVVINMLGASKRTYRRDIDSITGDRTNQDDYLQINTHREGIYDMLPEGLFHRAGVRQAPKSKQEVIKQMRERKAEEEAARHFFKPFETAVNHLRMQAALYEIKLDKRAHYKNFAEIFSRDWPILDYLDAIQANIFVELLPVIHEIRDNYPIAETIFELILMLPVSITSQRRKPMLLDSPSISVLGENGLGVDFTTGNTVFDDGENELTIKIGPMSKIQLAQFNGGSRDKQIFDALCDYLLPVHVDITTEFELLPGDKAFVLVSEGDDFNSVMGFSTYL